MKKILIISSLLYVLIGINSCKKPTKGVEPIISFQYSEYTASFQFIDAATGEQVGLSNSLEKVEVSVHGPNSAQIKSNVGSSTIAADKGFLSIAVQKNVTPSASNPIKFHIVAHAEGYLSTSQPVQIIDKGNQHFIVYMVKISETPVGVASVVSSVTTNNSGMTTSFFEIQTPDAVTTSEKVRAKVTVPQGTVFLDKDNEVVSGVITTTLVHFNNQDESSLQSFPGGFSVNTVSNEELVFRSGGFIALEMRKGGGKEVKNFGSAIQMNVQIPSNTFNFEGLPIEQGMMVPIWSYDPETGKWLKESDQPIYFNSSTGKYEVDFEMTHLSYWNLDWYGARCNVGATINVSSSININTSRYVRLKYPNGQHFSGNYINVKNASSFKLYNAPLNQNLIMDVYRNGTTSGSNNIIGSLNVTDLCNGNYNITINEQTNPTVSLTVNASCADRPNQIVRPSGTVYVRNIQNANSSWTYVGQMVNGQISSNDLIQGQTYKIAVVIGGTVFFSTESYTINQTNYFYNEMLNSQICNLIN